MAEILSQFKVCRNIKLQCDKMHLTIREERISEAQYVIKKMGSKTDVKCLRKG